VDREKAGDSWVNGGTRVWGGDTALKGGGGRRFALIEVRPTLAKRRREKITSGLDVQSRPNGKKPPVIRWTAVGENRRIKTQLEE